jgi:hypothetical protein
VVADYTAKRSGFTGKINWAGMTSVLTTTATSSTPRNGCVSPCQAAASVAWQLLLGCRVCLLN